MTGLRRTGPVAAFGRRAPGPSPRQAERLIALSLRHRRGRLRELTDAHRRMLLGRRPVEHGRPNDSPTARRDARRAA